MEEGKHIGAGALGEESLPGNVQGSSAAKGMIVALKQDTGVNLCNRFVQWLSPGEGGGLPTGKGTSDSRFPRLTALRSHTFTPLTPSP